MKEKFDFNILGESEFVVLDIETTGFSPAKGGRIIEIGAVKIKDGEKIGEFSKFINPEIKIPKKITELTGITNDMVQGADVIGNVLKEFYLFINGAVIVAHNIKFDWDRFLKPAFNKIGKVVVNKTIDTKELSKLSFPDKKAHKLEDMCNYLNVKITNHHRAIDDAVMTSNAFLKMIDIHKDKVVQPLSLFDNSKETIKKSTSKLQIKRVKYWELKRSNTITMQRIYVNVADGLKRGVVYFDIKSKAWYVKEWDGDINLDNVSVLVLKLLKLETIDDLVKFRN